jgi:(p)ppGpp synthase/HD superfamily hydrolase
MNIIDKAKEYAINRHRSTNHLYDKKPYEYHLEMVYKEALKLSHLIPIEQRDNFLAAAWVHDVIEDCRETYNDVLTATNKEVAELAYALTNEKGKNRKERANKKYYDDMRKVSGAVLLKVCDRIANFKYSIMSKSRMVEMYKKENNSFINSLYEEIYDEAFEYLKSISNF